jgi:hypothetical protein
MAKYDWIQMVGSGGSSRLLRVLEVMPIDRRFWPRGLWARRLQKRGMLQR